MLEPPELLQEEHTDIVMRRSPAAAALKARISACSKKSFDEFPWHLSAGASKALLLRRTARTNLGERLAHSEPLMA
jgi:hypothetical protein